MCHSHLSFLFFLLSALCHTVCIQSRVKKKTPQIYFKNSFTVIFQVNSGKVFHTCKIAFGLIITQTALKETTSLRIHSLAPTEIGMYKGGCSFNLHSSNSSFTGTVGNWRLLVWGCETSGESALYQHQACDVALTATPAMETFVHFVIFMQKHRVSGGCLFSGPVGTDFKSRLQIFWLVDETLS